MMPAWLYRLLPARIRAYLLRRAFERATLAVERFTASMVAAGEAAEADAESLHRLIHALHENHP